MVACSFCGSVLRKGSGKMYVKRDGTVFFFCSNKCEKNQLKLHRHHSKVRWTKAFQDKKAAAAKPKKEKKSKGKKSKPKSKSNK